MKITEELTANNIFDTHAHYSDHAFDEDREEVLSKKLPEAGVKYVVLPGCNVEESESNIKIASEYDYIYPAVGIHPEYVYKQPADEKLWKWLRELIQQHKETVAVGEIGLDYHYEGFNKQWQADAFEEQLKIAKEFDLPVIIHARDATQDYIDIIKKYRPRGVVHCFSGSAETAKEVIKLGMYIGFTGAITFRNARKAPEAAAAAPADRILLETDCPYMAPEPFRRKYGTRCDSSMIPYTAKKIADIKGMGLQEFVDIACENGKRMYGIE